MHKSLVTFLCIFLSVHISFSQVWEKKLDVFESENAVDAIQNPDGSFTVIGYSRTFNERGFYVAKIDGNGFTQWISSTSNEVIYARNVSRVLPNEGSGYLIGGTVPGYNMGCIRVNENGEFQEVISISQPGFQGLSDFFKTTDGGFVFVGSTEATWNDGLKDIMIVKTDSLGNEDWISTFGSNEGIGGDNDFATCGFQSNLGGYIIGGAWGDGTYNLDRAVFKLNEAGELDWLFQAPPSWNSDYVESIVEDSLGNIYFTSRINLGWGLGKLDSNGNLLWEKFLFNGGGRINSVIITSDSSLAMTGWYGQDLYIIKTDLEGNYIWHRNYGPCEFNENGGEKGSKGSRIIETFPDKGFLITGDIDLDLSYILKTDSLGNTTIPPQSYFFEPSICTGETFSFNGQTYWQEGLYHQALNKGFGGLCDSLVVFNLSINSPTDYSYTQIQCEDTPYVFFGDTITTEGVYSHTLGGANQNGCDSTVSLTFIYGPETTNNLSVQICEGNEFIVNNQAYAQSGNYSVTIENGNQYGCDSIVNLNLEVLPIIENNLWVQLCQGESYSVGNQTFDESGDFQIYLTNENGCDSVVNLNLQVLPTIENNLWIQLCQGESYSVGNQVFYESGEFQVQLIADNGCDSIINLHLDVLPQSETFVSEQICDGESLTFGGQTFFESGEYEILLTSVETGCDSLVFLTLMSTAQIIVDQEMIICTGDSILVDNNYYSTPGDYVFEYSLSDGCDSIVNLTLLNYQDISLVDTIVVNDDGSGSGIIAISLVGGSPPFAFHWSHGSNTQNVQNLSAGVYSLTITDANNCLNEFTFEVGLAVSYSDLSTQEKSINIYPSPCGEGQKITLQLPESIIGAFEIEVFDISGKRVQQIFTEKPNSHDQIESTAFSKPGVYFVIIQEEVSGEMWIGKFVII